MESTNEVTGLPLAVYLRRDLWRYRNRFRPEDFPFLQECAKAREPIRTPDAGSFDGDGEGRIRSVGGWIGPPGRMMLVGDVPFCALTRESQAEIRAACEYWPED